jgi:tetratricopeptide (TPR) repeat protein
MRFVGLCLALCLCAAAQTELQPTQTNSGFDDLAQRAGAAFEKDPGAAADLYRQALAIQPSWAEGWFNLGATLYQRGHYEDAKIAFGRTAELAPEKGVVWAFLGLCEYQGHNYRAALANFEKGEALGLPDKRDFVSTVHNRAADICIRAGEFSAAIDQLKPLALLGDESGGTIEAFGISALGLPYLPSEVPAAKKALVQLAGRAAWEMSAARDADAAKDLSQLVAQFPNEAGVHYLDGLCLMAHEGEKARAEFQRELQINPAHVAARLQIAILSIRSGDPREAAVLAREAVRRQPGNALAHAVLARAYMQQNELIKAMPELQTAARIAPLNAQIHLYLEQVYSRLGKTPEAEKEKAEFVKLRSRHDSLGVPLLPDVAGNQ